MNKKVKNATPTSYNGKQFKSALEVMAYKTLLENGITPEYEPETFILWDGFTPTVPFWTRNKAKTLVNNSTKIKGITYTPDFIFKYGDKTVILEMKGFQNETFPLKFKMFRGYIESLPNKQDFILAEIFTKKQLLEFLAILKYSINND